MQRLPIGFDQALIQLDLDDLPEWLALRLAGLGGRRRFIANPLARPPKRDEKADCRHKRRALSENELRRLSKIAQLRPLAEYGRQTVKRNDADKPADKRSRRTWTRAPLTYDDLDAAAGRARKALENQPNFIAELEDRGRERALIYKALMLTGLRKGELASLTVGSVEVVTDPPCLVLNAADEKAGRGAEIPLRADLAADLHSRLADLLAEAQQRARAAGQPIPARWRPTRRCSTPRRAW